METVSPVQPVQIRLIVGGGGGGMEVRGRAVTLHDANPLAIRDPSGMEKPTTRLLIADLPLAMDEKDIKSGLDKLGVNLARNADKSFSRF